MIQKLQQQKKIMIVSLEPSLRVNTVSNVWLFCNKYNQNSALLFDMLSDWSPLSSITSHNGKEGLIFESGVYQSCSISLRQIESVASEHNIMQILKLSKQLPSPNKCSKKNLWCLCVLLQTRTGCSLVLILFAIFSFPQNEPGYVFVRPKQIWWALSKQRWSPFRCIFSPIFINWPRKQTPFFDSSWKVLDADFPSFSIIIHESCTWWNFKSSLMNGRRSYVVCASKFSSETKKKNTYYK